MGSSNHGSMVLGLVANSDSCPDLNKDPKYARLLCHAQLRMPIDVVKHAVVMDNLDPTEIDSEHNKTRLHQYPVEV